MIAATKPAQTRQKAPSYLSAESKQWFRSVVANFDLEPRHIRLLTLAAESWDDGQLARAAIVKHDITYIDKNGCPRERPEVGTARSARISFARLLRDLALDVPEPAPQPPRIGGQRW